LEKELALKVELRGLRTTVSVRVGVGAAAPQGGAALIPISCLLASSGRGVVAILLHLPWATDHQFRTVTDKGNPTV